MGKTHEKRIIYTNAFKQKEKQCYDLDGSVSGSLLNI